MAPTQSDPGLEVPEVPTGPESDPPQCCRHRHRQRRALRGRAAGSRRRAGARVPQLHRRSGAPGRLAGRLRRGHGGDGVHRRVLDSVVRAAGRARLHRAAGQRAACQERLGPQVRCAGLPVAAAAHELRLAARRVSSGRRVCACCARCRASAAMLLQPRRGMCSTCKRHSRR